MKTKAAILEKQNEPLVIRDLDIPPLREGQILVQMAYSGFCQSQLNEIRGYKGHDPYLPHTLGHEGSGTVLDIGSKVTKVRIGDHAVFSWIKGSGMEAGGTKYLDADRQINSGPISTFLTHAVISENRVIPIPKSMPLREASLFGCAMPTGAGVVFHKMKIEAGQSIAVFGLGGIGLTALIAAVCAKASPIVAIDVNGDKLKLAQKFGATHIIDASRTTVLEEIMNITNSKGVDFSLEAAGLKGVMETAYAAVKAPGGLCVVAGNLPHTQKIEIDPFDLIKGKKIEGTWGGGGNIDHDVSLYTQLFLQKTLPLSQLITHEFPLTEINELCDLLKRGQTGRGLIKFI